jgi:hypothetical protein
MLSKVHISNLRTLSKVRISNSSKYLDLKKSTEINSTYIEEYVNRGSTVAVFLTADRWALIKAISCVRIRRWAVKNQDVTCVYTGKGQHRKCYCVRFSATIREQSLQGIRIGGGIKLRLMTNEVDDFL